MEMTTNELLNIIDDLKAEIASLKQRVNNLEYAERQREDAQERAEEKARRHPRNCACNRCLRIGIYESYGG